MPAYLEIQWVTKKHIYLFILFWRLNLAGDRLVLVVGGFLLLLALSGSELSVVESSESVSASDPVPEEDPDYESEPFF